MFKVGRCILVVDKVLDCHSGHSLISVALVAVFEGISMHMGNMNLNYKQPHQTL